jgi:hypothetical protein
MPILLKPPYYSFIFKKNVLINLYNFSNLEVVWYCVLICVWVCFKSVFDMKKYQISIF